eukprot:GEMP01018037.1.p1 GENE.GEMP01018037.1~~GEMP01018037.1.p1  ORF type:complete len:591 (+),score=90.84 GEMP01018037.1:22-1773(+)
MTNIDLRTYSESQLRAIATQLARSGNVKDDILKLIAGENNAVKPSEEAIQNAEQSQYAEVKTQAPMSVEDIAAAEDSTLEFLDKAKFVPMRLSYNERKFLRLVDSAMHVSTYTDRVDCLGLQANKKLAVLMKQMCAVLSGLLIAHDYHAGQRLLETRDFSTHKVFFQSVFEIARRYKILNPERMRAAYGKMMYVLQDSAKTEVQELLEFDCVVPVKTVYDTLSKNSRGLELLRDPLLRTATMEIIPGSGDTRWEVQRAIKKKEAAIKKLASEYASIRTRSRNHRVGGQNWMQYLGLRSSVEEEEEDESNADDELTEDMVEQCIYSLGDHNTYLRFNREPCDRLIQYLKDEFRSDTPDTDPSLNLAIEAGHDGARLSHSHARQYAFVHQSLMLWRDVLDNMFQLWHLAEEDLLDKENVYELTNTGQGLNRVQKCDRVGTAMQRVVLGVQRKVGTWIGSEQVHLGDHNVPNGLMFIDKYTQVPRILGPVVLCLDKIKELYDSRAESRRLIDVCFGGPSSLRKQILADFFRHAFDGSGADNFFDAGSCIDGRLTSAWNWCSEIHKKPYYPIFLLAGFTGFDGKEGW